MTQQKSNTPALLTLMLTIVIDMMGFMLIFPLLPSLFMSGESILVSPHITLSMTHLYYGITLAIWPLGAFFGTPYLGELSDKFGRKNILIICLLMTGVTYGLAAASIYIHSFILFLLSRLLSGFFGGCYDIAQAAVADISPPKLKARNMGWITLALSIGLIIGPAITSVTSNGHFVHWFTLVTPFWIACGLSLINTVLLIFLFQETYAGNKDASVHLSKVFSSFLFIFTDKRVALLGIVFFLLNLGWGLYITGIPLILTQLFHYTAKFTGLFFCIIGAGCALTILFIQPKTTKYFSLKHVYIATTLFTGLLLIVSDLFPTTKELWIAAILFAIFEILCYSALLAMSSDAVTQHEQGKVMGGIGAVSCLSFLLSSLLLAWLPNMDILLPLVVAAITYLASSFLMVGYKKLTP